jgi:hypothetical protein
MYQCQKYFTTFLITDFKLSQWLIIGVYFDLGILHRICVGDIADVPEVHSLSISSDLRSILGHQIVVCTTFPMGCLYWSRRDTSHCCTSPPLPLFSVQNTIL